MDIKGQAAIVTGGASGLGAATARTLAAAGAKVAMLDVKPEGRRRGGDRRQRHRDFLRRGRQRRRRGGNQAAAADHGPARILVNCAGIGPAKRIVGRDGPMPLEDFERVIRVNLIGTFNMMRLAAAGMQGLAPLADGERGVIVVDRLGRRLRGPDRASPPIRRRRAASPR